MGNCASCLKVFKNKGNLAKHVTVCIIRIFKPANNNLECFEFESETALNNWLDTLQLNTNFYFSAHGGSTERNFLKYSYLYCQHNQKQSASNAVRKTDRKRKSGLVPDFACKAKIVICRKDGEIRVRYYSNHSPNCGLVENLKFQPFPKSFRGEIKAKVALQIDSRTILNDGRDPKHGRENRKNNPVINKLDHLTPGYCFVIYFFIAPLLYNLL